MWKCAFLLMAQSLWLTSASTLAGDKAKPTPKNQAPVSANLESSKKGWVKLTITNTSDGTIRFLDVPEGSGKCYDFWRVEALTKEKKKLPANLAYSPAIDPFQVTLPPRTKYVREFQLGAYVQLEGQEKPASIVVHYDVDFKKWTDAPHLRFSSPLLKLKEESDNLKPGERKTTPGPR
jgi:hypothetical protein